LRTFCQVVDVVDTKHAQSNVGGSKVLRPLSALVWKHDILSIETYPIPMALVSNESMPLIADSRVVRGNKITLELEHLAVCSWLERFIVKGDIPYLEQDKLA
jgi:hypothetical protein